MIGGLSNSEIIDLFQSLNERFSYNLLTQLHSGV